MLVPIGIEFSGCHLAPCNDQQEVHLECIRVKSYLLVSGITCSVSFDLASLSPITWLKSHNIYI